MKGIQKCWLSNVLFFVGTLCMFAGCARGTESDWQAKIAGIKWVDYSPPSANPDQGREATADAIRQDLQALRQANFTGLVTYGSAGMLGKPLLGLAHDLGFEGVILGVWDPKSKGEIAAAKEAAKSPIVLGVCVGNEGLMEKRYTRDDLAEAIRDIREATKKPVTTTETVDRYDDHMLRLGDWVFPNAHPYFSNVFEPKAAVAWTRARFREMKDRTKQMVMFKEVGLPTDGDKQHFVSEEAQCAYYDELATTMIRFAYFEAFDLPWKTRLLVEPHWGIFHADRAAKILGRHLISGASCGPTQAKTQQPASPPPTSGVPESGDRFYIYQDNASQNFRPTGRMGDVGDITMNENWKHEPYAGSSCMRFEYSAKGNDPHCEYPGKCGWAGVYWQSPPFNWGKNPEGGHDLSHFTQLRFAARAEQPATVEFLVGGIPGPYGDSLRDGKRYMAELGSDWKEFTIDLRGANLKHIIGGFAWSANKELNPRGVIFYLDEIRFETSAK
jgi:exo-beta-1,3-glucanase (GH17 family)